MLHLDSARRGLFQFLGLFLGLSVSTLQAGSVISLTDNAETTGKVTLQSGSVKVEGDATPVEVPLENVLEADFSDAPFHLNYFSSRLNAGQLPPEWKGQDIGSPPVPGRSTYTDGALTVTSSGVDLQRKENQDGFFFIGRSWRGDGQFTARLRGISPPDTVAMAGPMIRDNLDPLAVMYGMGLHNGGSGLFMGRNTTGDHTGWNGFQVELPTWFRLSWTGTNIDCSTSTDVKTWELINETALKTVGDHWIGLYVDTENQTTATAVFDQLTLAPPAGEPVILPAGVLLTSGSFLAGGVDFINPNEGSMTHSGTAFSLPPDKVAAVVADPVSARQIAEVSTKQGVILKNGDFLEGDLQNMQGSYVQINSIVLGPLTYYGDSVRTCVLHPVKPAPAAYEIRLKDGSILRASGMVSANGKIAIGEVSGITVTIGPDEIAQIRAGSAKVQDLIGTAWKVKSPGSSQPAAIPATTSATNAAATTPPPSAVTDANAVADLPPPATETWQGPNQEQILVAAAGSTIDFPVAGHFRALSLRLALSPDSPPNAQVSLHVLADGHDAGSVAPVKSGDAPRLLNLPLQDAKTLRFVVESSVPGGRLLIMDPVAIWDVAEKAPQPVK